MLLVNRTRVQRGCNFCKLFAIPKCHHPNMRRKNLDSRFLETKNVSELCSNFSFHTFISNTVTFGANESFFNEAFCCLATNHDFIIHIQKLHNFWYLSGCQKFIAHQVALSLTPACFFLILRGCKLRSYTKDIKALLYKNEKCLNNISWYSSTQQWNKESAQLGFFVETSS